MSLLGYAQERFLARKVLAELLQKSDTHVSPLFFQAFRSAQDLSVKKYIARKIVTDKFPRPKQAAYLLDQEFAFLPTATLRAAARILAKSVDKISHEIIQPLLKTRNDNVVKILFDRIVELRNEGAGGIANEFQLFWQIFRNAKSPHAQNRSLGILMSGHPDLSKNRLSIIARATKDPGRGKAALRALLKHPEINYSDICTIADHSNTPEVREAAARALSTEYNVFLGDMLSMKPTLRSR